ncbi:ATP-dependent DNA helicase UvrD2 [Candidatus Poriferisodalis sp.]|uniref:ATP-dependent DNA helicase UvrD2 n=1 Tax=Candidatus Poriferisodalis sp. TaxID=3101277 RepID=UPI003B024009
MRLTADALAGPPELGRSVLVRPGEAVPDAWSGCERVHVSLGDFSAAAGRRLRDAWLQRTRLVIELEGDLPDAAPVWQAPWWELSPGLTMRSEVLAHLLTANAVDSRDRARARFAPVEAALELGAVPVSGSSAREASDGDVRTDAGPVWCDGGPLEAFELAVPVVPAANLAAGSLRGAQPAAPPRAELAPDQQAAVGHLGGAACIVAPAGSGKTRVLTERARYLVRDLGVAAEAVCLVAFNVRARREMEERTRDLTGLQVRTLNSLALAICNGSGPFARPAGRSRVDVIDEMGVRDRLDGLVKRRRRAMTDQLAPWLEALSASRLGLRDPADVEGDFQPDVPEFSTLAPRYVKSLSADGLVDFDQQIIGAIEILLADPAARAAARRACAVLLVDEFQDLTPAHLLMIRLLAGPRADVFAVGDDDQTIYGYAGASPQWLIDFDKYFPGAAVHHLNVNYRCPPPVVGAAVNLLSHNHRRIDKRITALQSDDSTGDDGTLAVKTRPEAAAALRETVTALLDDGVRPSDIAVLTRVNSTLLVPQIVLGEMGVAADAPLGRGFMERTGVAGALAWLKLAVAPRHALPGGALSDAARRPPRGISPRAIEWIGEQRSLGALRALAGRLSDDRAATKIDEYADDIDMLRQRTANEQLSTQAILEIVRDELGLGYSLDTRLDASRRSVDRSAHGDDLRALISVAHLHTDPASFAAWLADRLSGFGAADAVGFGNDETRSPSGAAPANLARQLGVRLATVHRVKGLEWPHVVVYEASAGLMPHRLAHDIEEERRVFHVALTRCSQSVTFVSDDPPSQFLAELTELAPPMPLEPEPTLAGASSRESGGHADPDNAADPAVLPGTGSRSADRRPKPEPPTAPRDAALFEALRAWRLERSRAEGVRAFRVFSDAVLIALATRRPSNDAELLAVPGIGPAKRDSYGAEVLALIAEHA